VIPVSALDAETTDQRVEYACPRCDGVVAAEDTTCPHCGQQLEDVDELEAVAAAEEEPRPTPETKPLSAREIHVGPDGSRWTEEDLGDGVVRRAYLPSPTGQEKPAAERLAAAAPSTPARQYTPKRPVGGGPERVPPFPVQRFRTGKFFGGLALIVLGVFLGLVALFGIGLGRGFSGEPASYWSAGDTITVLVFGGAFIPGVWLVVSAFSDASNRLTWGITWIIVGATYSLVAGSLVGRDDSLTTGHSPVPVPTSEYVSAALIGAIPLLIGVERLTGGISRLKEVALLASGSAIFGPITDAIFGLLPLTAAALLAWVGVTVISYGYPLGLLVGFVILGLAIGLGAAGVFLLRRAYRKQRG
jgi:hypothetical protein